MSSLLWLPDSGPHAAIIILWGFSGVIDEINENIRNTAELIDYLTDKLDEGAEEEKRPEKGSDIADQDLNELVKYGLCRNPFLKEIMA